MAIETLDFRYAKIYKIYNPVTKLQYFGGTTCRWLSQRMAKHRFSKDSRLNRVIGNIEDCKIELVKNVKVENIKQLREYERFYIENFECVNKNIPNRSKAEYMRMYRARLKKIREHNLLLEQ